MEFNSCRTCLTPGIRAGDLIGGQCLNCFDTRVTGELHIYANFGRTQNEIRRTMDILKGLEKAK